MLKFVVYVLNLKRVIVSEWLGCVIDLEDMLYEHCLLVSLDLDPLCAGALAHPVTSSWLYLHLFNKVLWCLTDTTGLARCDNSSAGRWLYICSSRFLPLGQFTPVNYLHNNWLHCTKYNCDCHYNAKIVHIIVHALKIVGVN